MSLEIGHRTGKCAPKRGLREEVAMPIVVKRARQTLANSTLVYGTTVRTFRVAFPESGETLEKQSNAFGIYDMEKLMLFSELSFN